MEARLGRAPGGRARLAQAFGLVAWSERAKHNGDGKCLAANAAGDRGARGESAAEAVAVNQQPASSGVAGAIRASSAVEVGQNVAGDAALVGVAFLEHAVKQMTRGAGIALGATLVGLLEPGAGRGRDLGRA